MSLSEEIRKLIKLESTKLINEKSSAVEFLNRSFKRVSELQPLLNEIVLSADHGVIKTDIKNNWDGYTAAAFIRLGDIKFYGDCTNSGDLLPIGDGAYWYFVPECSTEGKESWSFHDYKWGQRWFDSAEQMFSHLIPLIAKEIAKLEQKRT